MTADLSPEALAALDAKAAAAPAWWWATGPLDYVSESVRLTSEFVAAASPDVVRALIAACDRLRDWLATAQDAENIQRARADAAEARLADVRALRDEWAGRETNDDTWHMYEELREALAATR